MTQDEIIEMAREAGFPTKHPDWIEACLAFAKLVAEKERAEFAVHAVNIARQAVEEERERIIAKNIPEIEKCNAYIKSLEDELTAIRARGEA